MAKIKLFWTITAVKQRNYIFKYWNSRNKSNLYSKKLLKKINNRIELIKTHPKIGKKVEFDTTRIISLGHYSILYKQINSEIYITGFWDNRQDPKKLLDFIKNN